MTSVLGRIRWWKVMLGIWATVLFSVLLTALVASHIRSLLYGIFEAERPGGAGSFTGRAWDNYVFLSTSVEILALLLAFFLGGIVVGVQVPSSQGLNGATSSAALVSIVLACLLINVLVSVLNPISNPGEVYTRAENLQMSLVFVVAFVVLFPFAVLSGYLGGMLGGRLRNWVYYRTTA